MKSWFFKKIIWKKQKEARYKIPKAKTIVKLLEKLISKQQANEKN